jgi:chromosome condensin MukBEF MukE localization factor
MENIQYASLAALHSFQIWNTHFLGDPELGFWVKPRSTTWLSRFMIEEYDDERRSCMFRMTKASVF